jgi:uncharacterized protein (DUF305 family)
MTARTLTFSGLLAAALLLSACGDGGTDTAGSSAEPGSGHSSSDTHTDDAQANDAEVAFLIGMRPHHEQAVEMSDIVLAANPPAEVAELATQVKDAQAPEIEQMNAMLADLGKSSDPAEHGGEHAGAHGGMMSEDELAALKAATGTEAARLYLEAMIEHHEGAIEASEKVLAEGQYEPVLALARSIAEEQAAEISTMEQLLSSL